MTQGTFEGRFLEHPSLSNDILTLADQRSCIGGPASLLSSTGQWHTATEEVPFVVTVRFGGTAA